MQYGLRKVPTEFGASAVPTGAWAASEASLGMNCRAASRKLHQMQIWGSLGRTGNAVSIRIDC